MKRMMKMEAAQNTDKELWRESEDAYSPSMHVTTEGGIGISVGGTTHVKDVRRWHQLAEDDMERGLWGETTGCRVEPYIPGELEKAERYIQLLCLVNQSGHSVNQELSEAIKKYREAAGI
jgi:hypothetical protein